MITRDPQTWHRFAATGSRRTREQMSKLTDEEVIPGDLITEHIASLPAKCCRGVYNFYSKTGLADVFRFHGESIAQMTMSSPGEPEWGWDMSDRENGFPCVALLADGRCSHHGEGKPKVCVDYPRVAHDNANVSTCSISFDAAGAQVGTCDGCVR